LGDHTRKAYMGIRQMLFHNDIVPGQKISYRELAEKLGMSQTPVIQALKWLEFQQLVHHEPNRGYSTAPVSVTEVEEIYDLRKLIELNLLPEAIRRLDEQGLGRLSACLDAHAQAAREVYLYERLARDMDFHLTLASLARRQVQHQVLTNLFDLLYLKYGGRILFATSMDTAAADHRQLFECVAARDAKGARAVLTRHVSRVKAHVLDGLAKMDAARRTTSI
jgi:DNA-binding GntR family transcriptional regulator